MPTMTKTDYLLLAAALKDARPHVSNIEPAIAMSLVHTGWEKAVKSVTDALARQAPGFDRELFLLNCGASSDPDVMVAAGLAGTGGVSTKVDMRVRCECGWRGRVSELVSITHPDYDKECPACRRRFIKVK